MRKLNYVAWIKITVILVSSLFILTSNIKGNVSQDLIERLIGCLAIFLLLFFGVPAFFKPNENFVPTWNDSPFLFKFDPEERKGHRKRFFLICFHFSGYLFLSIGIIGLINVLIRFGNLDLISLQKITMGAGFLIGIYRATKPAFTEETK